MNREKVPFSQGDEEVNVVGAEREDVIMTMCLSFDKVFCLVLADSDSEEEY